MLFEEPLKCKLVAAGQLRGATLTRKVQHGGARDKFTALFWNCPAVSGIDSWQSTDGCHTSRKSQQALQRNTGCEELRSASRFRRNSRVFSHQDQARPLSPDYGFERAMRRILIGERMVVDVAGRCGSQPRLAVSEWFFKTMLCFRT
jgi:hypothetical protein